MARYDRRFSQILSELQRRGSGSLETSPEWIELRTKIMKALAPYPEARAAIVKALGGEDEDQTQGKAEAKEAEPDQAQPARIGEL